MGKIKKAFFCQSCGTQSPKWVGKCNSCNEWNTYVEEIIEKDAQKGAYVVADDGDAHVVLVGNGSEVSTLVGAAEILRGKGITSKIVSAPSEGVFREQSSEYQEEVIPSNKPIFGLTAGLPLNLEGLVGPNGRVFGLDHFGYSAPATVLDDKFGFTPEKVAIEVEKFLR